MALFADGWVDGSWTAAGWASAAWEVGEGQEQGLAASQFFRRRRILRGDRLDLPNHGMIEGTLEGDGDGYRLGDSERGFMGRRRVPK